MTIIIVTEPVMDKSQYTRALESYYDQFRSDSIKQFRDFNDYALELVQDTYYEGDDIDLIDKSSQATRLLIQGYAQLKAEGREAWSNAIRARIAVILKQIAQDASRQVNKLLA